MTLDPESARRLVRESYDQLGNRYASWAVQIEDSTRARYAELACELIPKVEESSISAVVMDRIARQVAVHDVSNFIAGQWRNDYRAGK